MTVLEVALEALRQYQQDSRTERAGECTSSPSGGCEKSEISEKRSVEPVEPACRCAKWPFPHVHSPEDRRRAINPWNRNSQHKVEWIQ
jgi:hypothetical protein